jgi:hypothetical protein
MRTELDRKLLYLLRTRIFQLEIPKQMHIKTLFLRFVAIAVVGLTSTAASATVISGDWTGNWSGSGVTATFNMSIGPQDSFGRFNGSFDWTCTSGIACSGIENFTGGLGLNDSFAFWTTGFVNPVNLTNGFYWGNLVNDGNSIVGFDQGPRDRWFAERVHPVSEPSSLILLMMSLLALSFFMYRKLSAATTAKTR